MTLRPMARPAEVGERARVDEDRRLPRRALLRGGHHHICDELTIPARAVATAEY